MQTTAGAMTIADRARDVSAAKQGAIARHNTGAYANFDAVKMIPATAATPPLPKDQW